MDRRRVSIEDNHKKTCTPLNQRVEDRGLSYVGTCSLCGEKLSLWPVLDKRCPRCRAKVVDYAD